MRYIELPPPLTWDEVIDLLREDHPPPVPALIATLVAMRRAAQREHRAAQYAEDMLERQQAPAAN